MIKVRKQELLRLINIEIGKVQISKDKTSADVKKFREFSPSQSGDKFHSESAAELTKRYLEFLTELRDEVAKISEEEANKAIPVCYVQIKYNTGEEVSFYFVERNALLPGVLLITPNSPIGKAVNGKKEGDGFSYEIEKTDGKVKFSGIIQKVE